MKPLTTLLLLICFAVIQTSCNKPENDEPLIDSYEFKVIDRASKKTDSLNTLAEKELKKGDLNNAKMHIEMALIIYQTVKQ